LVQATNIASSHSSPSPKSQQASKKKGGSGSIASSTPTASSTSTASTSAGIISSTYQYSAQRSHLHKPSSARQCASELRSSYTKAQSIRMGKPEYAAMNGARSRLPSFEHAGTVNQLVKDSQIVLITGDTGCGRYILLICICCIF
jgi:HrpA-like RNA helicase